MRLRSALTAFAPVLFFSMMMFGYAPVISECTASQFGEPKQGFVARDGTSLVASGREFHYAGANCYYLMVYAADSSLRHYVDEVLEEAAEMNLSVIRTWAFNDGSGWNALQTSPRVYDEDVFEGLDYVLNKCSQLGLYVILPLVNNWDDYGGMNQYVSWSPTATTHDHFYTDDSCRVWYKAHASKLINRVNTFNGLAYRNDPTVLAWELGNEPRCSSDPTGNTLVNWIEEMSLHIRSADSNHLITTGIEGFYDDGSGPWYLNGSQGVDFIRDHQVESVDFATAHSWPDNWGLGFNPIMSLVSRQIYDAEHVLGKPFILEEFGKHRDGTKGTSERDQFYAAYYCSLLVHECAGSNYWIAYHDEYPDYDGYGVYYPADTSTVSIIRAHAVAMDSLNTPTGVTDLLEFSTPLSLLQPNFPNPFNPTTTISFELSRREEITIRLYDVSGRLVRTLVNGESRPPGRHAVVWDGSDDNGHDVPSGTYFCSLCVDDLVSSEQMVLLR